MDCQAEMTKQWQKFACIRRAHALLQPNVSEIWTSELSFEAAKEILPKRISTCWKVGVQDIS